MDAAAAARAARQGDDHGAEALDYGPSTVSEQLAELEREAGVPLLERAGRNVRLTEAGRVLAQHAEGLLASVEAAEAHVAAVA